MSQYNKTVLTNAGLELAKRANAGQAKFEITRAVTSADDWSNKTIQDLEAVTAIPNIMQQGTVMDTEEVESNNSVIGVSLCFANKDLSTGYQIKIIGLYVKEEGQDKDFLYAVTTAVTPEYMPDFNDKVLYRFNMQMYLVIGKAQAVNVVINDGASVTHGQFDKYKSEVTANLEKIENTHKEDMSHVAKSASINGGAEILPDSTGKLNLVVPDPDLSKYVSLEQLGELLQAKANVADVNKQIKAVTDLANAKANSADVYTKTETDNQINKFDLSKVKFRKQYLNGDGDKVDKTWSATKNDDGTYTIDLYNDDWTAAKLADVIAQLPNKANASDVYTKIGNNTNVINTINEALKSLIPDDTHAPALPAGFDLNNYFIGWRRSVNTTLKNMPFGWLSDTMYFQGTVAGSDGRFEIALYVGNGPNGNPKIAYRFYGWDHWKPWVLFADNDDISNLQNAVNSKADKSQVNVGGSLFRMVPAGKTWSDILGFDNGDTPALVAFRGNTGGAMDNLLGNYSAGVAFGGGDTKGFLEVSYKDHNARIGGGNGNAPVWHEDIAWKSDVNDLRNQVQQLRDNQFEVQTFTDATAAANWEAQRPGKRMAIVNS